MMIPSDLTHLLYNCGDMLDFRRAINICNLVYSTDDVPGDVCEFGVYKGHTAALIGSIMGEHRFLYLYDSFEGLPEKSPQDVTRSDFVPGYLKSSREDVLATLEEAHVKATIWKGWFSALTSEHLPDKVSFAHIDGDFYQSTMDALKAVWPRMSSRGMVVIDDYGSEDLQGVKIAVDEFFLAADVPGFGHAPKQAWLFK